MVEKVLASKARNRPVSLLFFSAQHLVRRSAVDLRGNPARTIHPNQLDAVVCSVLDMNGAG